MKTLSPHLKWLVPALVLAGLALVPLALVAGQGTDIEPNDSCAQAYDFGPAELPFLVEGSLDTPPFDPDVDFFRFSFEPGTLVRVDLVGSLGGGPYPYPYPYPTPPPYPYPYPYPYPDPTDTPDLADPLLGLFDSNCALLAYDDDGGSGSNSRLRFTVPEDGVFILAASSFPDFEFVGAGGSFGRYRMTVAVPPLAGSISGQVVDQVTGEPLPGDSDPFTFVVLNACVEVDCSILANVQYTDSEGRFHFETDFNGLPLEAGVYQLNVSANEYQLLQVGPFEVAEGEHLDLGTLELAPFPVGFELAQACDGFPFGGGVCRFRVRIINQQAGVLRGAAWSVVSAYFIGSFLDLTTFQIGEPQPAVLQSLQSKEFRFQFNVPRTVADGAVICPAVYFGENPRAPFFHTLGVFYPFCLVKGGEGFSMATGREARELLLQQDLAIPDKLPAKSLPEK